jgi:hypothetical protein
MHTEEDSNCYTFFTAGFEMPPRYLWWLVVALISVITMGEYFFLKNVYFQTFSFYLDSLLVHLKDL